MNLHDNLFTRHQTPKKKHASKNGSIKYRNSPGCCQEKKLPPHGTITITTPNLVPRALPSSANVASFAEPTPLDRSNEDDLVGGWSFVGGEGKARNDFFWPQNDEVKGCIIFLYISAWWLNQPIWKIWPSNWESSPAIWLKTKKYLSCHLDDLHVILSNPISYRLLTPNIYAKPSAFRDCGVTFGTVPPTCTYGTLHLCQLFAQLSARLKKMLVLHILGGSSQDL